jgi:hypothetical protein
MNRIMRLIVAAYAPLVGRMTVVEQLLPPLQPEPVRGHKKKARKTRPDAARLAVPH